MIFIIVEGNWIVPEVTGKKPCPRAGHTAVIMNNLLVVFGGTDNDNVRLQDTWVFDLKSTIWNELKANPSSVDLRPRNGHSAILFKQRYMVIFGGIYSVTKELDDVSVLDIPN